MLLLPTLATEGIVSAGTDKLDFATRTCGGMCVSWAEGGARQVRGARPRDIDAVDDALSVAERHVPWTPPPHLAHHMRGCSWLCLCLAAARKVDRRQHNTSGEQTAAVTFRINVARSDTQVPSGHGAGGERRAAGDR